MSDLRVVARRCFDAALRAVDPEQLVRAELELRPIEGPATLIAVGKAGVGMASGALGVLGEELVSGLVVVPHAGADERLPSRFELLHAGHPVPDRRSVAAAERVHEIIGQGVGDETLLVLLSGGASALLADPVAPVTLDDLTKTTGLLLASGASIDEINAVRKHLDGLKGGGLARRARASRIFGLVLSDVVGDRLDVIASGPLTPDPTTFANAIDVLQRRGLWLSAPASVRDHLSAGVSGRRNESAKAGDPTFDRVDCTVIGSNRTAQNAALVAATEQEFAARRAEEPLLGEARDAGRRLAGLAKEMRASRGTAGRRQCVVAAGETTVRVTGSGRGGRNQEVALGAALELERLEGVLVASLGTDGRDGPTDAAGAWADGRTVERAREAGFDVRSALEDNDAYPLLDALGDLIFTGSTGTNVTDLALVLVD
jgi:hydroxypyruvate reductase